MVSGAPTPPPPPNIYMVNMSQTANTPEALCCFDLSLLFPGVSEAATVAATYMQILHIKTEAHDIIVGRFGSDPKWGSAMISVSPKAKPELILLSVKDLQGLLSGKDCVMPLLFEVSIEVSTIALSLLVFLRAPFHHNPHTRTTTHSQSHTHTFSHTPPFKLKYCL